MAGEDAYSSIMQADPAAALPLPSDPGLNAAGHQAAIQGINQHERRNRVLASYIISHILDENLKGMIETAYPHDGFEAYRLLRAHCYREPNDLTILEMNKDLDGLRFLICWYRRE